MAAGGSTKTTEGVPPCKPSEPLAPGLYLVATPIGNLRDITLRALDTLAGVDIVACEDTRVTGKLLQHYGISVPMTAYHEHNAARARPKLLDKLRAGGRVALVSDAGTPLVSDPGYKLVREAAADGLPVTAVPGASATLAALQLSALPTDRFSFAGFLPPKQGARRKAIQEVAGAPGTLIFFESAGRLAATLDDLLAVLGDRPAAVAREITKLHEEVRRGSLSELAAAYAQESAPRGEVVVLAGPARTPEAGEGEIDAMLRAAFEEETSLRAAVDAVVDATGAKRRAVYQRALALKGDGKE